MRVMSKTLFVALMSMVVMYGVGNTKTSSHQNYAWLGVITQSVNENIAKTNDLNVDYGAYVKDVLPDSPADDAGLEKGDVIVGFNNYDVRDADDLIDQIEDSKPEDKATIHFIRDNKEKEVDVILIEKPKDSRSIKNFSFDTFSSNDDDDNSFSSDSKRFTFKIGEEKSPYIGAKLIALTNQLRKYFGVRDDKGVLIAEVEKDSPAEKAGLKAGDVIIAADDEEIFGYDDLKNIIENKKEGEDIDITVIRNKEEQNLKVKIAMRDNNSFADSDLYFHTPDVNVHIPKMKRMYFGKYSSDNNELKETIDDLREQIGELKEELGSLKEEQNDVLNKQLKELKQQMETLKKRLD